MVRLRRSTNEVFRLSESSDSNNASLQLTRRADLHAAFDPDDTIVPPCLENLPVDAR